MIWYITVTLLPSIDAQSNAQNAKAFAVKISTMMDYMELILIVTKKTMFL
jgi:hypothetical protein